MNCNVRDNRSSFSSYCHRLAVLRVASLVVCLSAALVPAVAANGAATQLQARSVAPALSFEETKLDSESQFVARLHGGSLVLDKNSVKLSVGTNDPARRLDMKFAGAERNAALSGEQELPGKTYHADVSTRGPLTGNPTFRRVRYSQIYPGVDAVFYGNDHGLEFDFQVAPHADPRRIRLSLAGADHVKIQPSGDLSLLVGGEEVQLKKPAIFQEHNGVRSEIAGGYRLSRNHSEVQLEIGSYDPALPLIIDPTISFATYFGGSGDESATQARVNSTGAVYLLGSTSDPSALPPHQTFPIPVQAYSAQCFLTKLSPDASTALYTVVFDGAFCGAMDLGTNGRVHLALGYHLRTLNESTMSLDLLQGAYDLSPADGSVSLLRADTSGNVYFVTTYTPQDTSTFIFELRKIDPSGQVIFHKQVLSELDLVSYGDQVIGLDVDQTGRAYIVGQVKSVGNISPTPNAFQSVKPSTHVDGFLLKINTGVPDPQDPIEYASYLGGSQDDFLDSVIFDPNTSAVLVSGFTSSPDFPTTPGTFAPSYTVYTTNDEAILLKLDLAKPPSEQMVFGTYLGARSEATAVSLLPGGQPVIAGFAPDHPANTSDPVFPLVNSLYPAVALRDTDYRDFVSIFSPDAKSLLFSTFLTPIPNSENSSPTVATNGSSLLYVAADTNVQGLGVGSVFQTNNAGGHDLLLRAFDFSDILGGRTASSITLVSSPNPAGAGQAVTFTATVSSTSGTIPDGEMVSFSDGASLIGSAPLGSGIANLTTSALLGGNHSITANYAGDSKYLGSVSTVLVQTINPTLSSVAVNSSPNPSVTGQSVTFTAIVSGVSPTGSVTFTDNGSPLGSPATVSGGSASLTTSELSAGSHSIVANYGGDSTNLASSSQPLSQVVNLPVTSSISITSSTNPSIVGQSVTFTANVTGQNPTGILTFMVDSTTSGDFLLTDGMAMITKTFSIAGSHSISAEYNGDSINAGSVSPTLFQIVNSPGVTTVNLSSSSNPSVVGGSVTFTANVSGTNPTGTITFLEGATPIGTGYLTAGKAILTTASLTAGSHSITAAYDGDWENGASTSSILVQTVNAPYLIFDLGTLGGTESYGYAINNNGDVTGSSFYPGGDVLHQHAFRMSPPYTSMIDIDTLGSSLSYGKGINDVGQVAGTYQWGYDGAFLTAPPYGFMLDIGSLGRTDVGGSAINDVGQIAGAANIADGLHSHAFLWDGTMHDLGTLAGVGNSYAFGINNSGQVTGWSDFGHQEVHAFIYTPGSGLTDLGTLGAGLSIGQAINNSGQVAGYAWVANNVEHAFLWDGTMHDLGTLSGGKSFAFGINSSGQVVGASQQSGDYAHAFLYTPTNGMEDLNALIPSGYGWKLLVAYAINDSGQITGSGISPSGQTHAFVLSPPPPAMGALISGTAVPKPASGTADAIFTVSFFNTTNQPYTVNFATADGTAMAGVDYVSASGTLAFAPGVTTQQIEVKVIGGVPNPSNLSFGVRLTDPASSSLLASGTGTILVPARPPQIAYTIAASPTALTIDAPSTRTSSISLQSNNGIRETAQLSAAWIGAAPTGVTFSLSDPNVTIPASSFSGASSTLSVTASASTNPGTFTLRVTSTSATGVVESADVTVTVENSGPPPTMGCCTSSGPFVDPAPGVNLGDSGSTQSPSGKYQVEVAGGAPPGLANVIVKRNGVQILPVQAAFWGFSPDDDRFVIHYSHGGREFVALYDLTSSTPATAIWQNDDPTLSSRIQFSPSGRYLFYTDVVAGPTTQLFIIDAHSGAVFANSFLQVAGAPIEGEDSFGTVSWGFGPNDTRFVYGFLASANNAQLNLVNLDKGPAQAVVRSIPLLGDTGDYWKFSSCGEMIAVVRQPGQQYLYIDLYSTKDGTGTGSEQQISKPVQDLQLHAGSSAYIATVNGGTDYTLGAITPDCDVSSPPPPPPSPTCCTSSGPFVNPAPGVNLGDSGSTQSPSGKYQVQVSGGAPAGLANVTVTRNGQQILAVQAAYWGFSPDDDRFVTHSVQGGIEYVALYDLTGSNPQAAIWPSADTTSSSRIQFSPSGRYLFYSDVLAGSKTQLRLIDAHTGTVVFSDSFTQVAGAPIEGEDSFGTVSWGFGPNDTRFVYGFLSSANNAQLNLINLEKGLGHALVNSIPLANDTGDYWKFSSCGEMIAVVRQPGQQYLYIDLYSTKDGTHTGSTQQISKPVQDLQLHADSNAYVATVNGTTNYTLGAIIPDCSITVAIHSPADILLIDGSGRRTGFNSDNGLAFNEIPGGTYTGVGSEPETITVPFITGTYVVEVTGLTSLTTSAPFRLGIGIANGSGLTDEHDLSGVASAGLKQRFAFTIDNQLKVSTISSVGTVNLVTTAKLTRLPNGDYQAAVTVTNLGTARAQNVQLTKAVLAAAKGVGIPVNIGDIAGGGGTGTTLVTFPASAGAPGSPALQQYGGTYTGGPNGGGGFVASIRGTLPQ